MDPTFAHIVSGNGPANAATESGYENRGSNLESAPFLTPNPLARSLPALKIYEGFRLTTRSCTISDEYPFGNITLYRYHPHQGCRRQSCGHRTVPAAGRSSGGLYRQMPSNASALGSHQWPPRRHSGAAALSLQVIFRSPSLVRCLPLRSYSRGLLTPCPT